ncbi:MAG TPA: LEA type 2 family protein [Burkholderiales bacterium]|nr:LEA type 2 family protein [Burkholderiales bacterium]
MLIHKLFSTFALVLALLLAGACAGTGQQSKLDVSIAELGAGQIGLLEQTYSLKLRVQNPNPTDITTDGMSFSIDLNGKPFARGVSNQSVTIPRLGEAMVDVTAVSDLSGLIQQMRSFEGAATSGLRYRLSGRFFSGEKPFPFTYSGSIKPPSTP